MTNLGFLATSREKKSILTVITIHARPASMCKESGMNSNPDGIS